VFWRGTRFEVESNTNTNPFGYMSRTIINIFQRQETRYIAPCQLSFPRSSFLDQRSQCLQSEVVRITRISSST
jgi:hypothetical protein